MRSLASQSADEWTNAIVDHGVKCPLKGEHFVWDDQVGSAFGVHCLRCGTTFTLSDTALRSDQSSRAHLALMGF